MPDMAARALIAPSSVIEPAGARWQDGLDRGDVAPELRVKGAAEHAEVEVGQGPRAFAAAERDDQPVDGAYRRGQGPDLLGAAAVGLVTGQARVTDGHVVEPFLAAPGDVDGRALGVEPARGGQPDAGRAAHDQRSSIAHDGLQRGLPITRLNRTKTSRLDLVSLAWAP
jgi:hypothetical protein